MTPYILQEKNDWFEEELEFLRNYAKPGMKVIDIGANYGLYTLTISRLVGNKGKIWAFEPTKKTADCLRKSISENNFTNIQMIQAGLSDRNGEAKLYTCPNSEYNSLSREAVDGDSYEVVMLETLDTCQQKYQWKNIDFIKLDAEGEEIKIINSGRNFLGSESPLIMFELKHGKKVNLPLINAFHEQGYDTYRLVPGLNVLVPFDPQIAFDAYLLNLFACKGDKASAIETEGFLVREINIQDCSPDIQGMKEYLNQFPFSQYLDMEMFVDSGTSKEYLDILSFYVQAHSKSGDAKEKLSCLIKALNGIRAILDRGESGVERLVLFSRIAFDAGEIILGMNILSGLINKHYDNLEYEITGPFFPAMARYDKIDPGDNIKGWLFSSVLEQCINMHAYSTYFTQRKTLPLLERLEQLGFISEDMKRIKNMIETYFPL